MLLVTGGSGYLGSELLHRRPDAVGTFLTGSARGFRLDVRDAEAVRAAFARVSPTAVIHTAYRQDDSAATLGGAVAVARAAALCGARLVHLSTDLVFDGEAERPYTEDDELRPINEYGRAKAEAERAVREAHPEALIVRTSLLYGGRRPGSQERLVADPGAVFFRSEVRCPTEVGDLAEALLELAEGDAAGVLHVAGADALDRYEFACLLAAARGRGPAALASAPDADPELRRPRNCALDSSRARALLSREVRGARAVLARLPEAHP